MSPHITPSDQGWSSKDYPIQPTNTPFHAEKDSPSLPEKESIIVKNIEIDNSNPSLATTSSCPRYYYTHEFEPNTQKVIRGGFPPLSKSEPRSDPNSLVFRTYPPPGNAHYELTSDARFPTSMRKSYKRFVPSPAVSNRLIPKVDPEFVPEPLIQDKTTGNTQNSGLMINEVPTRPHRDKDGLTVGEKLANTINWDRPTWVITAPGVSGNIYPPAEMRDDFINNINSGAKMLYCKKCKKNHIPPGPPITLQDRDTCYALLPEWFPTERVEKPWDAFTQLFNEIIVLDEMSMGFTHRPDPSKPEWNSEFHDRHPKWGQIGRREGWWKCRSGPDADPVERTCKLCHRVKSPEEEAAAAQRRIPIADRKAPLVEFIKEKIRDGDLKDRAVVEERARRHGTPLFFGPRLTLQQVKSIENNIVTIQKENIVLKVHSEINFVTASIPDRKLLFNR
jgi:hypothetical protein